MNTMQAPPSGGHRGAAGAGTDHIGNMGRYLYHIRNMLAWMLALWVLSVAAAVGVGVYLGSHTASQAGQSQGSLCQSLGGTDPSC